MNPVTLLRSRAGLTQQALAKIAGTSQPTIALYESGAKSPALSTLQRLAASLGFELVVNYVPQLTREDRRSLAYHDAIAKKLREDPRPAIERAKHTLSRMVRDHPEASALFDRWSEWLKLSPEALIARMLDANMEARDMRQVTPFAGALSAQERLRILKKFRKEEAS